MSFNFKVPFEIIIGTVPFQDSFPTFQQEASAPPLTDVNGTMPPIGLLPPFMMNQYPSLRKLIKLKLNNL